jgi:hypothetical protein
MVEIVSSELNIQLCLLDAYVCEKTNLYLGRIFFISSIQPFGPVWQEPEPSQGDRYGSGTLRSTQILRDRLPLLSPAFRHRARNGRLILPITCDFHGKL